MRVQAADQKSTGEAAQPVDSGQHLLPRPPTTPQPTTPSCCGASQLATVPRAEEIALRLDCHRPTTGRLAADGFRAMTSGAASPSPGASQAPDSASLVEHAQECRQADNGRWYTEEEFMEYYWDPHGSFSAWRWYWDRAEREAGAPGVSFSDARTPDTELMNVPWPPNGPPPEADDQYFVKATSSDCEESDSPIGGASRLATGVSATGGISQAPSSAPLVGHAQECREGDDGRWYTEEEFMEYYWDMDADGFRYESDEFAAYYREELREIFNRWRNFVEISQDYGDFDRVEYYGDPFYNDLFDADGA